MREAKMDGTADGAPCEPKRGGPRRSADEVSGDAMPGDKGAGEDGPTGRGVRRTESGGGWAGLRNTEGSDGRPEKLPDEAPGVGLPAGLRGGSDTIATGGIITGGEAMAGGLM